MVGIHLLVTLYCILYCHILSSAIIVSTGIFFLIFNLENLHSECIHLSAFSVRQ